MYNFTYFVIYNQQIQKGQSETFSRYNGILLVWLAVIVHLSFIGLIIKKIISRFYGYAFVLNKGTYLPIIISFLTPIIFYYNRQRTDQILKMYSGQGSPTKASNFIKVLSIIFIPLIIGAILSKKWLRTGSNVSYSQSATIILIPFEI